jgi:hypothetical protein
MSGYTVTSRLRAGPVRTRTATSDVDLWAHTPNPEDDAAVVVEARSDSRLDGWLADARASWAQTTFYLFHEEGWR